MNKAKIKDMLIRAAKTFWQAAIGYALTAIAASGITDISTAKAVIGGVIASAIAAGASAVWNGVISPMMSGGMRNE